MKTNTTLSIDVGLKKMAEEKNINLSNLLTKNLKAYDSKQERLKPEVRKWLKIVLLYLESKNIGSKSYDQRIDYWRVKFNEEFKEDLTSNDFEDIIAQYKQEMRETGAIM